MLFIKIGFMHIEQINILSPYWLQFTVYGNTFAIRIYMNALDLEQQLF